MVGKWGRVLHTAGTAVVLSAGLTATGAAALNSQAGTSGFAFLKLAQTARLAALGSAGAAEVSDPAAFQLNPAGLTQQRFRTWSASYANIYADVQSGFLSYSQALGTEAVIGASIVYLSTGSIPKRDALDNDLGSYSFSDFALSVAFGTRVIGDPDTVDARLARRQRRTEGGQFKLDAGLAVKGIHEKLDVYSASGLAVDLGLLAHLPDHRSRLGVSLVNLGKQTSAYAEQKDKLPTTFIVGVRHRMREAPLLVAADMRVPNDNKARFSVGAELRLGEGRNRAAPLALRAGYNSQGRDLKTTADDSNLAGLSFGLGLHWRSLMLDYAFSSGIGLGSLHRFTLSGRIGAR